MIGPRGTTYAFCGVSPTGAIDIDLLRMTVAAAQYAAKDMRRTSWPELVSLGWKIVEIELRVKRTPPPPGVAEPGGPAGASRGALLRLGRV